MKVIDLSFPIDKRKVSSVFETFSHADEGYERVFSSFNVSALFSHEKDGFSMQKITIPTHTPYTAHLDAPYHELLGGKTIDQMPLDRFLGDALVLDARSRRGREVSLDCVGEQIDEIQENDAILIRTDWDQKYGTQEYFKQSPFISMKLAAVFVEKRVRCVGIDFPIPENTAKQEEEESSSDHGSGEKFGKPIIHYLLLGKEIYIIESMANFHKISEKRPFLITLPLNIVGADGFPVRAVAVEGLSKR